MERQLSGKKNSKIWVLLARLENAVPFATGSCGKFKADVWLNGSLPPLYARLYHESPYSLNERTLFFYVASKSCSWL